MIKGFQFTVVATALLLVGCGGGGGADSVVPEKLTLTVGNTSIDSSSSLSRVTTTITDVSKDVTTVKINKEGTLSIEGDDADLFELTDISDGKQLSFKNKPEASVPEDNDADGIYEINIKGEDTDSQSVTYKAAYKIIIPRTTLDILNGNTYYVDLGDNNYTKVTYDASGFTAESYSDTVAVGGSEETFSVTYNEETIKFNDDGKNITCIVKETPTIKLTCSAEGQSGELNVTYLNDAPEFVAPDSYTLTATAANTINNTDTLVPKIASFSVTGNASSQDGKVIISKSKMGGKFSYSVTIDNAFWAKGLMSGLKDGDRSIIANKDAIKNDIVKFDCIFNNDNGVDSGIDYTCNTISQNNTVGNADTNFYMGVCNDDDIRTDNPDLKCSQAEIPVLFID